MRHAYHVVRNDRNSFWCVFAWAIAMLHCRGLDVMCCSYTCNKLCVLYLSHDSFAYVTCDAIAFTHMPWWHHIDMALNLTVWYWLCDYCDIPALLIHAPIARPWPFGGVEWYLYSYWLITNNSCCGQSMAVFNLFNLLMEGTLNGCMGCRLCRLCHYCLSGVAYRPQSHTHPVAPYKSYHHHPVNDGVHAPFVAPYKGGWQLVWNGISYKGIKRHGYHYVWLLVTIITLHHVPCLLLLISIMYQWDGKTIRGT